jgi:hypothetical protein
LPVLHYDQLAVRSPVVAEEAFERHGHLSVGEPLSLPPGAVLGNAAGFFLREEDMIVIRSSPLPSKVQIFSFSK